MVTFNLRIHRNGETISLQQFKNITSAVDAINDAVEAISETVYIPEDEIWKNEKGEYFDKFGFSASFSGTNLDVEVEYDDYVMSLKEFCEIFNGKLYVESHQLRFDKTSVDTEYGTIRLFDDDDGNVYGEAYGIKFPIDPNVDGDMNKILDRIAKILTLCRKHEVSLASEASLYYPAM